MTTILKPRTGWSEYLLTMRYADPQKLKSYLQDTMKLEHRLSTHKGFYVISTPYPLTPEQKRGLDEAANMRYDVPSRPKKLSPHKAKLSPQRPRSRSSEVSKSNIDIPASSSTSPPERGPNPIKRSGTFHKALGIRATNVIRAVLRFKSGPMTKAAKDLDHDRH